MQSKETTILIVDDSELNCETLSRRLVRDGYKTLSAQNGSDALSAIASQPVDLILLDFIMPDLDGYAVLTQIKAMPDRQHIPVLMVSALEEQDAVIKCIEAGADDFLVKPINPVLMKARISSSLNKKRLWDKEQQYHEKLEYFNQSLKRKVQRQLAALNSAQMATIFATSKLAESRDPETGAHLERLREFCRILSEELQKTDRYTQIIDSEFITGIYAASPLHDIGKVGIPDDVLLKPGQLNDNDWQIMRAHPLIGANTLRAVAERHPGNAFVEMGINIAECHHEKWDGSGYPHGLSGEEIPLEARILALADVYDALTSVRCYKPAFSHEKSRGIILENSGTHFDPDVVNAFLQVENEFIRIKNEFSDDDEQYGNYQANGVNI